MGGGVETGKVGALNTPPGEVEVGAVELGGEE